ncbi:MAG TPA: hypothetical protein VKE71_05945 [Candidatus Angelobacter sp.]|nr:hypothetical protein [Candidatus Angelobacter sp.]
MQRYLRLTLATLLFAALTVVSANAQALPAEDDTWVTGSGTQVDFNNFGQVNLTLLLGSQPTNSVVSFIGNPLSSSLGQADTLVSRGSTTISGTFSATLSIKGLSLASSPDLTLQDGRVYHVTATLATQSDTGTMNFTTTTSEGGTFSSSFTVTPILTFTNVKNSSDVKSINCSDSSAACSFPMNGSGNWVQTSSTGFDPQSMGIPTVPSGVQIGNYSTVGRPRYGGIQVGCGGTKASGYGCGQNNELHGANSIGQAIHGTKPPNDCASPPPPPPGGGGGCSATSAIACTPSPSPRLAATAQPATATICATSTSLQ